MAPFFMNSRQCAEVDPSWDYENPIGNFTPGWYYWPETYEMPVGPYHSEAEAKQAAYKFQLSVATSTK